MRPVKDLGKIMLCEALNRKQPFAIEYSLTTDIGQLSLVIASLRVNSIYVSGLLIRSMVPELAERVRSPSELVQAIHRVIRELGVGEVVEFMQISARSQTEAGQWVAEPIPRYAFRKRVAKQKVAKPGRTIRLTSKPELQVKDPSLFTIQDVLQTLRAATANECKQRK